MQNAGSGRTKALSENMYQCLEHESLLVNTYMST